MSAPYTRLQDNNFQHGMQRSPYATYPGVYTQAVRPVVSNISVIGVQYNGPPCRDYLGLSVFLLVFFPPIGLFAILKSRQVRDRASVGDIIGAQRASGTARRLCYVGLAVGFFLWLAFLTTAMIIFSQTTNLTFADPPPAQQIYYETFTAMIQLGK
ncbi:proline-rich transmembrane protein 1-like [Diadema antillarum]|uniref:proline-rich transmembrane protein 1-like n=1 Tax=Diadema antillarum TaxID=105358 RepID=UPI003A8C3A42